MNKGLRLNEINQFLTDIMRVGIIDLMNKGLRPSVFLEIPELVLAGRNY